jgi:SAM-dependent methyltransferase
MIFMNIDRQGRQIAMRSIITNKEWSNRHLYDGEDWIEGYWRSRNHPHRSFLVERICKFSPNSVLEIGCACGPNLYHIAKKFPDAEVRGIDINPIAVQKGNEWFKQEDISNVKLEVGKAQELEQFADWSFDVVFTDAVLIYISPDEIKQVVKEMLRIGRVVVLNEWHTFNKWLALLLHKYCYFKLKSEEYLLSRQRFRALNCSFKPKSASLGLCVGHWVRDYMILFEEFVPKEKIFITKLPKGLWNDKGWQRWGAIIEVVK